MNSECTVEPRCYGLRVRKYSASEVYPDRIRRHRYRRCPYVNASDDQRDDQCVHAQAPILAGLAGGQLHLKIRQSLFKLSSIVLERGCFLLDEMPGWVYAGLIDEKFRALPRAIYYLLGRINGGEAFRLPHRSYLTRQICSLAITANFSLVQGVRFARDEIKG